VFDRAGVPKLLRPLVGGKVNVDLIDRNWADILRVAATMAAGSLRPSQILRKLAAYPRQNELAAALREVCRIERSLFMIDWTTDPGMRRRVQVGLNKGEAHHALKRAITFTSAASCGTEPRRGSTTGSPASTCWPRSSSTGTR
jgi:TnpA family transposase